MTEMMFFLQVSLGSQHKGIGAARHFVGGQQAPRPSRLAIGAYGKNAGFYLLYYDEDDMEITDTYHNSVDEAQAQAEFEFGIVRAEWVVLNSTWPDGERVL
ncbi:MAG: hypothetical protein J0H49_12555 [Acidobacteria bacterium]|nr:hypothetical protein [Acidobacteriota bacterium]